MTLSIPSGKQTQMQMLRLETFRTFATEHPSPNFDTGDALELCKDVYETLHELARDHPDRFNRHCQSSRLRHLQAAIGRTGDIYDKADNLDFNVTEHLQELKRWLTNNEHRHRLTMERLGLFLELARLGRNNFSAAHFEPDLFVTDDMLWLATVLKVAYST